jgi:hypothetical protein
VFPIWDSQIPDPDFYPSWIPDPRSQTLDPGSRISEQHQKRRGNYFCPTTFAATNIIKLLIILFLKRRRKFISQTLRIILLFAQKFLIKLSKIWVWDQGSGISDPGFGIPFSRKT